MRFLEVMKGLSLSNLLVRLLVISVLCIQCAESPSYEEVVDRELSSGERHDSLFMGIHLNMHMQTFYDHCYDLNQKRVFFKKEGSVNVQYTFQKAFSSPVDFVFFPQGGHTLIQKVKGYMIFQKWAPFTNEFTAGKLQEQLKEEMESWYGGRPFIQVEHPLGYWPYSYVKVDGNRKIQLYRSFDDSKVEVVFEDLAPVLSSR